jgi:hypothetical protein
LLQEPSDNEDGQFELDLDPSFEMRNLESLPENLQLDSGGEMSFMDQLRDFSAFPDEYPVSGDIPNTPFMPQIGTPVPSQLVRNIPIPFTPHPNIVSTALPATSNNKKTTKAIPSGSTMVPKRKPKQSKLLSHKAKHPKCKTFEEALFGSLE